MFQKHSVRHVVEACLAGFLITLATLAILFPFWTLTLYTPQPQPSSTVKVIVDAGHGSGVHIGDGFVVTAAHVVGDKSVVNLKLDSGGVQTAEVLWSNKDYDVALLRTKPTMRASQLSCRVASAGETIVARGNPASVEFVSAYGHVAGPERQFATWRRVLITDITTIPGMSGGGVFDERGEVVGIAVGVLVVPLGFAPSLTGFGTIVPSAAICDLLART